MSKKIKNLVYFDNNATTLQCKESIDAQAKWSRSFNPSSDSKFVTQTREMINKTINTILTHCNVNSATHKLIFTSGATESNCYVIKACVRAFARKLKARGEKIKPHVIISAVEHSSLIECLEDMAEFEEVEFTKITPTIYGNVLPEDIQKEIKINTCLISVMYANNEIPILNNIKLIGDIAHKHKIPLHTDCVQIFGKYPIDIKNSNIDALSASFHKFYGPKGVGLLILNNELIDSYDLRAEIFGKQQYGLRGGTENVGGIAAGMASLAHAFKDRKQKNKRLFELRDYFLDEMEKSYTIGDFANYTTREEEKDKPNLEIVFIGPPREKKEFILCNTVLLSVCKNHGEPFCNVDLKKYLDSKGCVVSIGSACNTKSDKASHVLNAIGAGATIKRGTIRISFGDANTKKEIDYFIRTLRDGIRAQCKDLPSEKKGEVAEKRGK